jgi:hypothetical protein
VRRRRRARRRQDDEAAALEPQPISPLPVAQLLFALSRDTPIIWLISRWATLRSTSFADGRVNTSTRRVAMNDETITRAIATLAIAL